MVLVVPPKHGFAPNSNSIQSKLHVMSFNIFIEMELNLHRVNLFISSIEIIWLSLVVCSSVKPHIYIWLIKTR
jgi:hypothetical protein